MGCYCTIVPEGFMIISINSIHFSVRNRPENDPEAPALVFAWLENKLNEAKVKDLKVILTYHLPHGLFLTPIGVEKYWVHNYEESLKLLLDRYSSIISGIYTGHMHLSTFNVSQLNDTKEYYAGVLVNRALSPIFGNNPGFALYYYIDSMEHPKYFEEYTFTINKTYNRTDSAKNYWIHLYNSYTDLGIENLSSVGISKFINTTESNLRKHLNYMVLRLGINFADYQAIDGVIKKICKGHTIDTSTYVMCVDSLNEYIKDN